MAALSGRTLPQFVDSVHYSPVFTTEWLQHQDELAFSCITLNRGEQLFLAREQHTYTYHIKSGLVKLYILSRDGNLKTLFYHTAGTQFGFQGFKHDRSTVSTAVIESPTEVFAIRYSDLFKFCDNNPTYYRSYLEYIVQVMNSQTQEIASLSFQTGMERLAVLLCSLTAGQCHSNCAVPFTIDELAEIIGTHRNTVSTALARFRQLGAIEESCRRIVVTDSSKLQQMAQ
ncbi:MAG: Crp/Fnr family transcriptional regulator [Coriobacteriales bacterium]|jgi:CRP/FNR family cyclic AMP-dependent transcriptional regulator